MRMLSMRDQTIAITPKTRVARYRYILYAKQHPAHRLPRTGNASKQRAFSRQRIRMGFFGHKLR